MLGGEDFDEELLKHLLAEFKKDSGLDLSSDPLAMQRLREAAEKAKRELDGLNTTDVSLPVHHGRRDGPQTFKCQAGQGPVRRYSSRSRGKNAGPVQEVRAGCWGRQR